MKTFEVLFKRGIGGKILQWSCDVINYNPEDVIFENTDLNKIDCCIRHISGEVGGKSVSTYSDKIEPKNIGKKNETTSYTQSIKECESLYKRQQKKGYKSFKELGIEYKQGVDFKPLLNKALPKYNTDADNCFKPMKCQKFELGKMNYPAITQPKINGVRATVRYIKEPSTDLFGSDEKIEIKSKEGLIYNVKHIEDVFLKIYDFNKQYDIVFDGELYIYGEPVTSIGGAARNVNNPLHSKLQFVCFDLAIPDIIQSKRESIRYDIFENFRKHDVYNFDVSGRINVCIQNEARYHYAITHFNIIYLCSKIVNSDEKVLNYRDECINYGYEGCVVRDLNAEYQFGSRPKTMRKCKKMEDAEFKILSIRSVGNPEDKVGFTIIYTLKNDITSDAFECNGTGTVEEKLSILNDKSNIGKMATVQFYERTINKLPFHANVIGIRDYE